VVWLTQWHGWHRYGHAVRLPSMARQLVTGRSSVAAIPVGLPPYTKKDTLHPNGYMDSAVLIAVCFDIGQLQPGWGHRRRPKSGRASYYVYISTVIYRAPRLLSFGAGFCIWQLGVHQSLWNHMEQGRPTWHTRLPELCASLPGGVSSTSPCGRERERERSPITKDTSIQISSNRANTYLTNSPSSSRPCTLPLRRQ
jgi:hypothetical protein